MKYSNILLVAAAIAATACAKEIVSENENTNQHEVQLYPMTFSAGADDGSAPDTKVTLEGKSVLWSATDKIKVFDGTEKSLEAFEITSGEGTTSAIFSGSVADPSAKTYYALYPYQADATCTASKITIGTTEYSSYLTVDLPETQAAVDGSVDPAAFIAVAVSDANGNFSFKNLNSLVKFRLSADDITNLESISISSNSLEAIAGSMNVAFNTSDIPVQTYVSGKMDSYVTLNAPEGGFKANTDYYFAIRSIGFASGLTITAKYQDGSCKHASSTKAPSKSLSRNSVLNLGTLTLTDGLPNDLYIAYLHGQDIDVAGVKINKATYGNATLHKDDEELKTGSGVHFVSEGKTITYNNDNAVTKLVILGRNKNTRSILKCSSKKYFKLNQTTGGYAIFHNLIVDQSDATSYFMTISADQVFDKVIFDNCLFKFASGYNIIYAATVKRSINNLTISSCDFEAATFDRIFIAHSSNAVTINNIVVTNNIIKGNSSNSFRISNGSAATYKKIVFKNNSLVNSLTADALFNIKTAEAVEIENNLFYASKATKNMSVVNTSSAPTFSTHNNYDCIVKNGSTQYIMKIFYNPEITSGYTEFNHLETSPFSEPETATQATEYASYGAQRSWSVSQSLSERQTWTGVSAWE